MNWVTSYVVFLVLSQIHFQGTAGYELFDGVVYEEVATNNDESIVSLNTPVDTNPKQTSTTQAGIIILQSEETTTRNSNASVITESGTRTSVTATSFSIPYAKSYPPDPRTTLSNGAVAGIMVAVIIVISLLVYFCFRYKNKKKLKKAKEDAGKETGVDKKQTGELEKKG